MKDEELINLISKLYYYAWDYKMVGQRIGIYYRFTDSVLIISNSEGANIDHQDLLLEITGFFKEIDLQKLPLKLFLTGLDAQKKRNFIQILNRSGIDVTQSERLLMTFPVQAFYAAFMPQRFEDIYIRLKASLCRKAALKKLPELKQNIERIKEHL